MTIDRKTSLAWVAANLPAVTPSFTAVSDATHPAAKDTSTVYVDTISYVSNDQANNPPVPFLGVWYDDELMSHAKQTKTVYRATWLLSIGVYLRVGYLPRYTRERALLQQIGEAWEVALVSWYQANPTLGNTIFPTGDGTANYYTLPLTPLPPWDEHECYGALLVIPVTQLV
jgi:hypothetical protein